MPWSKIQSLFGYSEKDADVEELSSLLKAILPTFIATVDRRRNAPLKLNDSPQTPPQTTRLPLDQELGEFYLRLYVGLMNLQAVLVQWSPADMIQASSAEGPQMKLVLEDVLSCIEERFLSRKEKNAGPAFKRLGIEHTGDAALWKLRALGKSKRLPPRDEEMPESYLRDIALVIRLDNKKAAKRDELLRVVEAANDFFRGMQPFTGEPTSSCPLQYLNYPMNHVSRLTRTLFGVIQSKWSCQCNGSHSHVSRKARWNLTQHQCFHTAPIWEAVQGAEARDDVHCYRVLFPTTSRETEWQDTDIAVDLRQRLDQESRRIDGDLCRVISGVRARIRPRMAVWAKELWQLREDAEECRSVLTQIKEAEFVSLKELLLQQSSHGGGCSTRRSFRDGTWRPKDRLILSFILATTLLHLSKSGSRLRADFNSDSICFLQPPQRAPLDITRPYLTVSCASRSLTNRGQSSSRWNQPHRFPDILALGTLLLEIERGAPIKVDESQDPCVVALNALEDWNMSSSLHMEKRSVPEGLRHAIAACIQPKQLKTHHLDKTSIQDHDVRRYIFDRILYPLEEALFTAYEIRPHMLPPADPERHRAGVEASGFFDGEEDSQVDVYHRAAAKEWKDKLEGVLDLVDACQDQCADPRAGRVKIAVLDTGLQLPKPLRVQYEAAGRICVNESKSFVREADDAAAAAASERDWDSDRDGHGSRVGGIILQSAPCADLHVAKVFQTGRDLMSPALAGQVHKQIADAIDLATNAWKVDMIVMSFGFDRRVRPIHDAIVRATKTSKPPLFFAATGNNAAHQEIAWPASEDSVIGVSSTTADGEASPFNSRDRGDARPILYAFGQGVPVNVTAPDDPTGFVVRYMSGTSYATPIPASLAADLLGSVRMLLKASPPGDRARFAHVPGDVQERDGMLRVLQGPMQGEHHSGQKSLLPWEFLCVGKEEGNKLLMEVNEAISGRLSRG